MNGQPGEVCVGLACLCVAASAKAGVGEPKPPKKLIKNNVISGYFQQQKEKALLS